MHTHMHARRGGKREGEGEKERSQTNRHSAELLAADANKVERETDATRGGSEERELQRKRERKRASGRVEG